MTQLAELGIKIESGDIKSAVAELGRLERQGGKAEKAVKGLTSETKAFAAAASVAAVAAAGMFVSSVIRNTIEQEDAVAQLNATLLSTHNAVGMASDELQNLATQMQQTSTFGDEAIVTMESLLLTFTKIGSETFPRATQAILDMSAKMGQDLKSSATQVGKALNDPIEGVSALSRVGVQFTNKQKDLIKSLQESGKIMEAQGIILKELETQFGGSAKAARDTFGGALIGLKNSVSDLLEGSTGVPGLTKSINDLSDSLSNSETQKAATALTAKLFDGFVFATKSVLSFGIALTDIGDALGAYAAAAAAVFSGDFAGAKTILKMRDEQLAATNIAIEKIWEEKKATDELNKAKGKAPDVKPENKPQKVKIDTKAASKAASALEKQNADIRASALEAQAIIADIDPVFKAGLAWDGYVELVEGGYLTMEQAAEKYAQEFGEKSNDIAKTGTDDFKRLEDAVRGWGNKFTDTMATMVRTGKVDFGSLADSIINDLIRIQVQQRITEPLIQGGTALLSSIDFGSMFSFAGGGSTGSGARSGGVDGIGGFPAILHPNETVIDHTKSQSAHGGDTYIIDARGADQAAISRLEGMIISLHGSIERRAVGAVNSALMSRGQRAIA